MNYKALDDFVLDLIRDHADARRNLAQIGGMDSNLAWQKYTEEYYSWLCREWSKQKEVFKRENS